MSIIITTAFVLTKSNHKTPKFSFARTRFSNIPHSLAIKLATNRTNAFANSFIHMTSRDQDSPPRQSLRLHITFSLSKPSSPDTNSDPIPEMSSCFHDARVLPGLHKLYLFDATSCFNFIMKTNKLGEVYQSHQPVNEGKTFETLGSLR